MATRPGAYAGPLLPQDLAHSVELLPGLGGVLQHRTDDLTGDGGIALHGPHPRGAPAGVVPLLVRASGEASVVEGARDRVGIATIELDLDAEGLVGIPNHVLALVCRGLRSVGHLE